MKPDPGRPEKRTGRRRVVPNTSNSERVTQDREESWCSFRCLPVTGGGIGEPVPRSQGQHQPRNGREIRCGYPGSPDVPLGRESVDLTLSMDVGTVPCRAVVQAVWCGLEGGGARRFLGGVIAVLRTRGPGRGKRLQGRARETERETASGMRREQAQTTSTYTRQTQWAGRWTG